MEYGQYHHSYIMKLFDRSVDLAQFDEDTPLYPICRAWMKNEPHGPKVQSEGEGESPVKTEPEAESSVGYVYDLPPPQSIKLEQGEKRDVRIPSPLPSTEEPLDIYADPGSAPDSKLLLVNHMIRWKTVRQKWKDAARLNEMLYADSLNVIKELYDRQNY